MANKLQQGISILYDLELNNYLMEKSIKKLNYIIDNLGYYRGLSNKPTRETTSINWDDAENPVFIAGLIGFILGIIVGFTTSDGFFETVLVVVIGAIIGAIIGVIIGGIIGIFYAISKKNKRQENIDRTYNLNCKSYQKKVEDNESRIAYENIQKKHLIEQRNILIKRKKEATSKLNKYYNIMGIDINYRNIVPIGYMNEFMRLGIATKLEGANGLYYLVRQELRADQLKYSLDEISRKLETIISNQHELYYQISDMNAKCDKMIASAKKSAEISAQNNQLLNQAVTNTSISAYNSQRIKEELRFQNFMMIYNS